MSSGLVLKIQSAQLAHSTRDALTEFLRSSSDTIHFSLEDCKHISKMGYKDEEELTKLIFAVCLVKGRDIKIDFAGYEKNNLSFDWISRSGWTIFFPKNNASIAVERSLNGGLNNAQVELRHIASALMELIQ